MTAEVSEVSQQKKEGSNQILIYHSFDSHIPVSGMCVQSHKI